MHTKTHNKQQPFHPKKIETTRKKDGNLKNEYVWCHFDFWQQLINQQNKNVRQIKKEIYLLAEHTIMKLIFYGVVALLQDSD